MEKYNRGYYVRKVDKDYCVLDTETTGLSAYVDRIIEIGIIKVRDNVIVAEYDQLINPECELDEEIARLTGITNEMLVGQPTISEVRSDVLKFMGNDLIVGHNTYFDMQFMANGLEHDFDNEYIDTLQFARKLYPDFENHKLETLVRRLDLPANGHRALLDCRSTKALLDCMVKKMQNEGMMTEEGDSFQKGKRRYCLDITQIVPDEKAQMNDFFLGKHYVFTGELEKMNRREAMQRVVNAGGVLDKTVCRTTEYLVVGSFEYCSLIKNGKTGKLKRAEELKQKGQDIKIIDENTFYDLLEG